MKTQLVSTVGDLFPGENPNVPKYVRTKHAKGRLYYYFEMEHEPGSKPVLRRLPDITMPHFRAECSAALREREGRKAPDRTDPNELTVYFVGERDSGPIKIGLARNPQVRLTLLQIGNPNDLHILATVSGGRRLELAYHRQFAEHRVRGEWFERCAGVQGEIDRLNALLEAARRPAKRRTKKQQALSAPMVACVDLARESGGELIRYQGGFWASRDGGHPLTNHREYHGTSTVQAVVDRGYAEYSEHRDGKDGPFPVAFKLTDKPNTGVWSKNGESA